MLSNLGNPVLQAWESSVRHSMKATLLPVVMLLLLMLMSFPSMAQERSLTSRLSSTNITRDESVTLTVIARGIDAELDATALGEDFDVVGRSSSREVMSLNGGPATSIVTWALELIPRDVGVFTVPAVNVADFSSQIHTLTVNDLPSGAQRDIFVEATVDTQSPWVQSQVVMTLRVFQAIDIVDGGLDVPSGNDLVVERIGEDSRSTMERDGRQYSVTERRFALFPQKSGEIVLEPITLSVSVPADRSAVRSFFSATRKITRRTDPIILDVQPRPDSGAAWWLPARAVELESQWVGDIANATVDQPLTRRIVMRANGVADSQLPEINIPAIDGVSVYAEQPERAMRADNSGLVAEQVIQWALIPQRAGVLEVPAVTVDWFNTASGQFETASLPAQSIDVSAGSVNGSTASLSEPESAVSPQISTASAPELSGLSPELQSNQGATAVDSLVQAAGSSGDQAAPDSVTLRLNALETSVAYWRAAAISLAAVSLLAGIYAVWRLRQVSEGTGKSSSGRLDARLGAVRQAGADSLQRIKPYSGISASAKTGDVAALKQALLEWSARQWPNDPPATLDALASRLPDSEAQATIAMINSASYSRQRGSDDATQLPQKLVNLPEQLTQALQATGFESAEAGAAKGHVSAKGLPSL